MRTIYIKNMVCDRCKMVVEQVLQRIGLHPTKVDLGEAIIEAEPLQSNLRSFVHPLKN